MIFLIFLLVTTLAVNRVENSITQTLKQYFECQNLKMNKSRVGTREMYIPDTTIANNTLMDEFYRRVLSNITYDQAMALVRRVYNETGRTCVTEFCKCTQSMYLSRDTDFSPLFRDDIYFVQSKRIVSSFIEKFKSNFRPQYNVTIARVIGRTDLLSLIDFFVKFEFSLSRILLFESSFIFREFPFSIEKSTNREVCIELKFFSFKILAYFFKCII